MVATVGFRRIWPRSILPALPATRVKEAMSRLASRARIVAVALLAASCAPEVPSAPAMDEILWDRWGVPHVYGTTDAAVFRGQGWAQMESHGDLVLRLYGQARGRAAEYWGEDYLDSDRWVRTMGIPARGAAWLAAQPPAIRQDIEAFADGVNAYAAAHPDLLDDEAERVLPVTAADVLAHFNRVIHFTFVTNQGVVQQAQRALARGMAFGPTPVERASEIGSNAWAIGPTRSASGNAMLVANPHLPWGDLFLFWESQLVGPDLDVYGVTLVGIPGVAIGFNDRLGWTHTVNTYDGADLFSVERSGDGYRYGSEVRAFERRDEVVRVRADGDDGGSFREESLTIQSTVHGPVVAEDAGRAVALRVAGLDQGEALEEWLDMGRARDLTAFEGALSRLQNPMFNVLYADADKHIFYLFNAIAPRRPHGDAGAWQGAVDGSDPTNAWGEYLGYGELPRMVDPPTGWIQNANDPPWTTTIPQTLDADAFPAWLAPRFMGMRPQRSALMLLADSSITFDEMVAYKHSTRMSAADRWADELVAAARASQDADARRAADVLESWDRTADADSRGGVLFTAWLNDFPRSGGGWAEGWSEAEPVATPRGLADPTAAARLLGEAARTVEAKYGALDVRWGDVHHAKVGDQEVEVSGAPGDPAGVFRVAAFQEDDDGRRWVYHGDTYYAALEFTPSGVNAKVLLAYGNATQRHSKHVGDQLELYARKEMRTPWRTRADIEANLESRTDLSGRDGGR